MVNRKNLCICSRKYQQIEYQNQFDNPKLEFRQRDSSKSGDIHWSIQSHDIRLFPIGYLRRVLIHSLVKSLIYCLKDKNKIFLEKTIFIYAIQRTYSTCLTKRPEENSIDICHWIELNFPVAGLWICRCIVQTIISEMTVKEPIPVFIYFFEFARFQNIFNWNTQRGRFEKYCKIKIFIFTMVAV